MAEEQPKKKWLIKRYGSNPGIVFQSPDGEKCAEKTVEYGFLGGKIGVGMAIIDVMLLSKPSTYMGTISRAGIVTVPAAAGFATYAATSCLVGSIRNKNDFVNHWMGGFAGAFVFNIRAGTKQALGFAALMSVIFGVMKQAKIEGHNLMPDAVYPEFGMNREKWMLPPPEQRSKPPDNY